MTTHEYLKQIKRLNSIIVNHADEYEHLMALATSITAPTDGDRVKSSTMDKLGNTVAKMVDYSKGLAIMITERDKIIYQLEHMTDVTSYNILFRYYVIGDSFMDLARDMHYSKTHISRLYHKALELFEKEYGMTYLHRRN